MNEIEAADLKNRMLEAENNHLVQKLGSAIDDIRRVVDNMDSPVVGIQRPWSDWAKQCYDIATTRGKISHETTQEDQVDAIDIELDELNEAVVQAFRAGTDSSKSFLENYSSTVEQELCDVLIACGTLAHLARVDLDKVMPMVLKYNSERKD